MDSPQARLDKKWPEKATARRMVRDAIKRGTIIRPRQCSKCRGYPLAGSDGRSTIQAHHHKGYDFPLEVEWLCAKCHTKIDARPKGSDNGLSVLNEDLVSKIKFELLGGATNRGLARQYCVSPRTISRIRSGECWDHVSISAAPLPRKEG